MRKLGTALCSVALVVGLAACGSGASSSASGSATTSGSATHSGTKAAQASGGAAVQTRPAKARALTQRGQRIVRDLGSAAGKLATGNAAGEQQARQKLAQLTTSSDALASNAAASLPASSPARVALVATGHAAASAANEFRHVTVSPVTKQRLRKAQGTLNGLAASLGNVYGKVNGGSIGAAAHVAKNLATLKVELARSGY